MSAAKFVLTYLYENRATPITLPELAAKAKPYKIPIARISTSITPEVRAGTINRVGKGTYELSKAGVDAVEKKLGLASFYHNNQKFHATTEETSI